jgi:hypothetical protein
VIAQSDSVSRLHAHIAQETQMMKGCAGASNQSNLIKFMICIDATLSCSDLAYGDSEL